MITVSVKLHSARDGSVTEIARMHIINDGTGTDALGNYSAKTFRGRTATNLSFGYVQRTGRVEAHPRRAEHIWNLVAKALSGMGYGKART